MLTVLAPACLPYWKLRCTCRARLISAGALVSCAYFSEYVHELRISRTPSRDVQSDCKFAQMISSSLQDGPICYAQLRPLAYVAPSFATQNWCG